MSTQNPFGRAMEKSSENFLQLLMHRDQMEMERQRLALSERQVSDSERAGALSRLISVAPFLPTDRPIAAIPSLHADIKMLYPDADPTNLEDLGGVVMHEGTLQDIMLPKIKEQIGKLPADQQNKLFEMTTYKALTGEGMTSEEASLRNNLTSLRLEAINKLTKDPVFFENLGRGAFGMPMLTRVNVGGKMQTFDTPQAAQLAVDIWKHRDMMAFYREKADEKQTMDIAGELMKDFNQYSKVGSLGRAAATKIVQLAYGKNGGAEVLVRAMTDGTLSGVEQAAAQYFAMGAKLADDGVPQWIKEMGPGGEQLNMLFQAGNYLKGIGIQDKDIPKALPSLIDFLGSAGVVGMPEVKSAWNPTGWFNPDIFGIELNAAHSGMPTREDAHKAADSVAKGEMSSKEVLDKFGTGLGNVILREAAQKRRLQK